MNVYYVTTGKKSALLEIFDVMLALELKNRFPNYLTEYLSECIHAYG